MSERGVLDQILRSISSIKNKEDRQSFQKLVLSVCNMLSSQKWKQQIHLTIARTTSMNLGLNYLDQNLLNSNSNQQSISLSLEQRMELVQRKITQINLKLKSIDEFVQDIIAKKYSLFNSKSQVLRSQENFEEKIKQSKAIKEMTEKMNELCKQMGNLQTLTNKLDKKISKANEKSLKRQDQNNLVIKSISLNYENNSSLSYENNSKLQLPSVFQNHSNYHAHSTRNILDQLNRNSFLNVPNRRGNSRFTGRNVSRNISRN